MEPAPHLSGVYFDDYKVTYTPTNIVQYNEYYPYGLQTATSWTRENATGNNFLGNGGTELNTTTSLYDLEYRNYDPALARMHQVDPMADKYASYTPYNYSFNAPSNFNDVNGADPFRQTAWEKENGIYLGNRIMDTGTFGGSGGWAGGAGGGHITPGSGGNHWSNQFSGMTAGVFINNALNSSYGGSWGNGQAYFFSSHEEGFFAGVAYNNYHNSWENTEYGSAGASLVAFGIIRESGQMATRDEVQNILNPSRLNTFASTSNSAVGDPWYMSAWKSYTDYLRTTPMFGTMGNPFFMAEAIYGDFGLGFVGAERDWGSFLLLVGTDKGSFVPYNEVAGGLGIDIGFAFELGRVDITGNPNLINASYLFGGRNKFWVSVGPVGGSFAWGNAYGETVTAIGVQVGISVNPFFSPVTGGWNTGEVYPRK